MFSSIYHVHCSIYHVHCSIYMVHCSIYHVFLEKNEFAKLCITRDSNLRSHADRKAALTTAPRALIPDCVCARYQYVRFCIAGSTSPGGWCRTSGAGPAAPPAPAMTSPARASTWIVRMPAFAARHAGEAEMCRWTAARWRNRPRLEPGEHAGRRAVRAHEACHTAVRVSAARCAGRLGNRYWRHDSECKGRQQECPNNGHHCISCHLRWFCWFARATACLIQLCTQYMAASPRNGPGTCFKTQSYEIQGNPCNHCGGHAFGW